MVNACAAIVTTLVLTEFDIAHAQWIDHRENHELCRQFSGNIGITQQLQQMMQNEDAGLLVSVQGRLQINLFVGIRRTDPEIVQFGAAPGCIANQ